MEYFMDRWKKYSFSRCLHMVKKVTILLMILYASLYSNDIFVGLSNANTINSVQSSYEVTETDGFSEYGSAATGSSGVSTPSIMLGYTMDIDKINSHIDPAIGYSLFMESISYTNVLFLEVPLLYRFSLWNQAFGVGPEFKYLYFLNTKIISGNDNVNVYSNKSAQSYGAKLMLEKKSFDAFIFYSHLNNAEIDVDEIDGQVRKQVHVNFDGNYMGIGIQWKF